MNSYAMLMQTVPTLMAHTTASANLDLLEMVPVVQVGVLLETLRFEDEQETFLRERKARV